MKLTTLALPVNLPALQPAIPDHYATLGLDRRCTETQIRAAYRVLAKQHHPDVNGGCAHSAARTRELNAAYEILSNPAQRRTYDAELAAPKKSSTQKRANHSAGNIAKEAHLRPDEFLRGTRLEVRVNDAGNPDGVETYELIVPPETAPGTRFKIARDEKLGRSFVVVRVKARPDFRFKVRGPDLRCDLKISSQRALQGGTESVRGVMGNLLRVPVPKKAPRGETICIAGEGLPKPRGGRGDLLVRIVYTPQVSIKRPSGR